MTPTETANYNLLMAAAKTALESNGGDVALVVHNAMDDFVGDMSDREEALFDRKMVELKSIAGHYSKQSQNKGDCPVTFGGNRYLQTPDDLAMRKKAIALLCGYIETLDAGIAVCVGRGAYQAKIYRGQRKARLADLIDCYGDNGFFVLCDFGANGLGPAIEYAAQSCHRHAEYERERNVTDIAVVLEAAS